MSNLETVQGIYAAFGRGDIPAILATLADDVDWEPGATTDVPWLLHHKGRDAVAGFFESLDRFEMNRFEPHTILESGNTVISLINVDLTVKRTGIRVTDEPEVHIWKFNDDGKVASFAHRLDTHAHMKAFHGE